MLDDEIRLTQLRRMLGEAFGDLDAARDAVGASPERLAAALVAEAAASDDVASVEAARDYIEARLADLAIVPVAADGDLRAGLAEALATWA